MRCELILGNKNYAPWSLRAWLCMKPFGIDFDERVIDVYSDEFERLKRDCFPARQVPVLRICNGDEVTVLWDSLAIAEFMAEQFPGRGLWPSDLSSRAAARAVVAEMHCGFRALRSTMPMNMRKCYKTFEPSAEALADIERISDLWRWIRKGGRHRRRYLFGDAFSIADAFFAPVAFRFKTYGIELDQDLQRYADALTSHPDVAAYYSNAIQETWTMPHNDFNID